MIQKILGWLAKHFVNWMIGFDHTYQDDNVWYHESRNSKLYVIIIEQEEEDGLVLRPVLCIARSDKDALEMSKSQGEIYAMYYMRTLLRDLSKAPDPRV